ncbi:hypothetical protein IG193_06305 [Infirmifilum lucidum]|uniref:Uncharacterized protein n=1 Tax=Infirmifilum lucidum TaxID=2776706 RepID=A0A7L9FHG8_9CREN|nr:hypothetical protein [Infirmifilum lucidum]QOJ78366.1 hypothetical protein IG193_06305 [Infirmifilum lucidum]
MGAKIRDRLLATTSTFVVSVMYSELFLNNASSLMLYIVPAVSALVVPSLGAPIFVLIFFLELYRLEELFLLLALLPFLLFILLKNVHSWASSLVLLVLTPLIVIYPQVTGVVLGMLYYLAFKEKPREAVFTGVSLVANLFVISFLLLKEYETRIPLLLLPGGFQATGNEISRAALFYSTFANRLFSDTKLLAEAIVLVSSLAAVSLFEGKNMFSLIAPQTVLLSTTPLIGGLMPSDVVGLVLSVGTSSLFHVAEQASVSLYPRVLALRNLLKKRGREEIRSDYSVLFTDVATTARELKLLCETLPPGRKIVILGLSEDEEKLFVKHVLGGKKCAASVVFFHELGLEKLLSLPPNETIVVYIRILDEKTALSMLSKLTGFDAETIRELVQPYLEKLKRISRVTLYNLSKEIDELIKQGVSARKAFDSVMSRVEPELNEEFIQTLEKIYVTYEIVGFAR